MGNRSGPHSGQTCRFPSQSAEGHLMRHATANGKPMEFRMQNLLGCQAVYQMDFEWNRATHGSPCAGSCTFMQQACWGNELQNQRQIILVCGQAQDCAHCLARAWSICTRDMQAQRQTQLGAYAHCRGLGRLSRCCFSIMRACVFVCRCNADEEIH